MKMIQNLLDVKRMECYCFEPREIWEDNIDYSKDEKVNCNLCIKFMEYIRMAECKLCPLFETCSKNPELNSTDEYLCAKDFDNEDYEPDSDWIIDSAMEYIKDNYS